MLENTRHVRRHPYPRHMTLAENKNKWDSVIEKEKNLKNYRIFANRKV
jgi:2'-5' RNA ligase